MINRRVFFDTIRASLFGGKLTQDQVNGLTAILDYWESEEACKDDRHLAYALATTYHETDTKMQPINEYGGADYFNRRYGPGTKVGKSLGNTQPGDGARYAGRGWVQLTGRANYQKAGVKLGLDLLHHPELALRLDVATKILFAGMESGWFTGRKLSDYFNGGKADWVNARRIINGVDRAELIAGYGKKFYEAIRHEG